MIPPLDAVTKERLDRFATLLLRWNARLNLIAPGDEPLIWQRHIVDLLQLAPLVPPSVDRAIDLGSGGGFPGLVLAVATGVHFDLIEFDQRKASFLRTAALETGAPVAVHARRIEDATLEPASLVTARALAPLPRLLPLVAPLLAPEGTCLLLKGARVEAEAADAAGLWDITAERIMSQTSPDGVILQITGLKRKATLQGQR